MVTQSLFKIFDYEYPITIILHITIATSSVPSTPLEIRVISRFKSNQIRDSKNLRIHKTHPSLSVQKEKEGGGQGDRKGDREGRRDRGTEKQREREREETTFCEDY